MPRLAVALETSSRPSSIAISVDGGAPQLTVLDDAHSHASDLLPLLSNLVREAGGTPADVDRVVVGTGPGSYTGLRVGCATALGLSIGLEATRAAPLDLIGIPSFEALAYAALEPGEQAVAVRNAFGGSVYAATYSRTANGLKEISGPACYVLADAGFFLKSESIWLADEGALKAIGDSVPPRSDIRSHRPEASALLALSAHIDSNADSSHPRKGPDAIKPLYLRPFEAKLRRR